MDGLRSDGFLTLLERAFAIGQHHDGITGTHAQFVQSDYVKKLDQARNSVFEKVDEIIEQRFKTSSGLIRCDYLNATICDVTEKGGNMTVGAYNPSGWSYNYPVRIPVKIDDITVVHLDNDVKFDLVPLSKTELAVRGNRGNATHTLVIAPKLSANDLITANFSVNSFTDIKIRQQQKLTDPASTTNSLTNNVWNITFGTSNKNEFEIKRIESPESVTHYLNISVIWYNSSFPCSKEKSPGVCKFEGRESDAYTFVPYDQISHNFPLTDAIHEKGNLFDQIELVFDFVSVIVRLYKTEQFWMNKEIEIEWTVLSYPLNNLEGKNIVVKYQTSTTV